MEGFDSVFDQLLSEEELLFLIESLGKLDEPALAAAFHRAHDSLRRADFYGRQRRPCHTFGQALLHELKLVDRSLDADECNLWALDHKLAQLAM